MASNGIYTTQYGYGCRTQRGWGRPDLFSLSVEDEGPAKAVALNFSLVSGGILSKLQTNIQNSIVNSIQFTNDENGCADFSIKLNKQPAFTILPNTIIEIQVGNSGFNWYKGVISFPDFTGTDNDVIDIAGFGLRKYLDDLKAFIVYTAGTDVSDVVEDIAQTWIAPYCPISYNAAKIDGPSGVVLSFDIELGKYSIREIMETLILMAQTAGYYYIWGVDADGDFYFTRITNDSLVKTFFIGYNCQEFKPKLNFQDIKNVITVTRKQGAAAGGAGWSVGGVYNDAASVAKYGRQELVYQVPGYFSDDDCDLIGNALIENLSEPNYSAQASGIRNWSGDDFLENGLYRFIMPKMDNLYYDKTLNDLDDYTDFTISGAGDLALSDDTAMMIYGSGSVKLNLQNAINQVITADISAKGFIKGLKLYVRSDYIPVKIQIGVGLSAWNENATDVAINIIDNFIHIDWDLSDLGITEITKFGIKILANYPSNINIWVDKLDVIMSGNKTYRIKLLRATYKYSPNNSGIRADFGGLPPSLVQYIAGLQQAASELKFTSEVS
jgi:hypothetical protein